MKDPPPVRIVRPACGICHAMSNGETCGCEAKMRHPYWMFVGFRPVYRPHQRAIFHRLLPPRPHMRSA